jgi:hypothetical protein
LISMRFSMRSVMMGQPQGCIIDQAVALCNQSVAYSAAGIQVAWRNRQA